MPVLSYNLFPGHLWLYFCLIVFLCKSKNFTNSKLHPRRDPQTPVGFHILQGSPWLRRRVKIARQDVGVTSGFCCTNDPRLCWQASGWLPPTPTDMCQQDSPTTIPTTCSGSKIKVCPLCLLGSCNAVWQERLIQGKYFSGTLQPLSDRRVTGMLQTSREAPWSKLGECLQDQTKKSCEEQHWKRM